LLIEYSAASVVGDVPATEGRAKPKRLPPAAAPENLVAGQVEMVSFVSGRTFEQTLTRVIDPALVK
jgi:hypothetical protein